MLLLLCRERWEVVVVFARVEGELMLLLLCRELRRWLRGALVPLHTTRPCSTLLDPARPSYTTRPCSTLHNSSSSVSHPSPPISPLGHPRLLTATQPATIRPKSTPVTAARTTRTEAQQASGALVYPALQCIISSKAELKGFNTSEAQIKIYRAARLTSSECGHQTQRGYQYQSLQSRHMTNWKI